MGLAVSEGDKVVTKDTRTFVVPSITVVSPVGAAEPGTTGTVAIPETTTTEVPSITVGGGGGARPIWEAIAEPTGFGEDICTGGLGEVTGGGTTSAVVLGAGTGGL